ncbi:MAG TPA: glucokinase [Rhodocyclaceae bacterium]|nr:glucokinase [Rhodocyclaceae bacterium]
MTATPLSASSSWPRLVGDVGGTNARFALETAPESFEHLRVLPCAEFPSLEAALSHYMAEVGNPAPRYAAIAIANPVDGDEVRMTNHPWRFSIRAVQAAFGLDLLLVVNDFEALAMSLPSLAQDQLIRIGDAGILRDGVKGLLGPGTGLGVAYLVPTLSGWQPQPCEGGHVSLAPDSRREGEMLELVRAEFGHVSAERLLSGIGIPLLYRSLRKLDGLADEGEFLEAAEVARRAAAKECAAAVETFQLFSAMLGGVAGNLALTLGSLGGVYVGGGIVPRLGDLFDQALFRRRFEAKGRFKGYLNAVPTFLITAPYPALSGCSALLTRQLSA